MRMLRVCALAATPCCTDLTCWFRVLSRRLSPVCPRVCHKRMVTATLDRVPIPLWVQCAGNVLRAGLVQFPERGRATGAAALLQPGFTAAMTGMSTALAGLNSASPSELSTPTPAPCRCPRSTLLSSRARAARWQRCSPSCQVGGRDGAA